MIDETVDAVEETKVAEEPKKKHKKSDKKSKKHKAKKEAKAKKETKTKKEVKKETEKDKPVKKEKAKSSNGEYRAGTVKSILFTVLKDSVGKTLEEMRSDKRIAEIIKAMQDDGKSQPQITNTLNVYFSELFTNNPIFFGKTFGKYGVNTKGNIFRVRESNLEACTFKCRSGKLTTKYAKRLVKE